MNQNANQQQLASDSTIDIHEVPVTDETPLTDFQENQDEGIQSVIPEALDWNTSMISEVRQYIRRSCSMFFFCIFR